MKRSYFKSPVSIPFRVIKQRISQSCSFIPSWLTYTLPKSPNVVFLPQCCWDLSELHGQPSVSETVLVRLRSAGHSQVACFSLPTNRGFLLSPSQWPEISRSCWALSGLSASLAISTLSFFQYQSELITAQLNTRSKVPCSGPPIPSLWSFSPLFLFSHWSGTVGSEVC